MLKRHRLAFAVVSISAWVWIYTCLRISICKRKINEVLVFCLKYVSDEFAFLITRQHIVRCVFPYCAPIESASGSQH